MKAFHIDDETIYAGATADEAVAAYLADVGEDAEFIEDGYPREVTDAELDAPTPEIDEDERPTGAMTSMRAYLNEMTEAGYLAGTSW